MLELALLVRSESSSEFRLGVSLVLDFFNM